MPEPDDKWDARILCAALIAIMLGLFVWSAGSRILEASLFLMVGVTYGFLLYRVVSLSVRAFMVMQWACLFNLYTLITLDREGVLGIPAAGPWFIGFLVGAVAGGYVWSGTRAGLEFQQKHKRVPDADGHYSGGLRLALTNGVCACVLLSIAGFQMILLSPTAPAVALLVVAVVAGWALFRFPPSLPFRTGIVILGLPTAWFSFAYVGEVTNQMALPHASAYGLLAGILLGGRYWSGPRLGEPRPPFNRGGRRRVRRKRRSAQKVQAEKPTTAAVESSRE